MLIFPTGLQTQSNTNPLYKGPWDAIKKIYGQRGIAGIYKGQAVTLVREATGYGVYFLTYEKLVQWEMAKKGIRRDQISPANSVIYGAAAGYAVGSIHFLPLFSRNNFISKLWALIYPMDMIKSRMQTDGFTPATGQKYASTLDCVRTVWRTEGIGAFTRGLGPTLIRYVSFFTSSYRIVTISS
jgi:solute carrier family 25 carnitine/acylcarnitine transporter 20/29